MFEDTNGQGQIQTNIVPQNPPVLTINQNSTKNDLTQKEKSHQRFIYSNSHQADCENNGKAEFKANYEEYEDASDDYSLSMHPYQNISHYNKGKIFNTFSLD